MGPKEQKSEDVSQISKTFGMASFETLKKEYLEADVSWYATLFDVVKLILQQKSWNKNLTGLPVELSRVTEEGIKTSSGNKVFSGGW